MISKLWKLAGILGIVILIVLTQIPSPEAKAVNSDFETENGVLVRYIGRETQVEIPESVSVIGEEAFSGTNVETVIIPDTVTEIRNSAFSGCANLREVEIGDSVSRIGSSAFMQCPMLETVSFGRSVRELGSGIFSGCPKLSRIQIDKENTSLVCEDGVLLNKDRTCLYEMLNGRKGSVYEMPDSITSVRRYAFWECPNVHLLVLSDAIQEIEPYAFANCSGLQAVAIPGSVTTIGAKAFADCRNLEIITLTSSTRDIHVTAFDGCTKISIYAPDNSVGARYAADNGCQSGSLDAYTVLRDRLIARYEDERDQAAAEDDADNAGSTDDTDSTDDAGSTDDTGSTDDADADTEGKTEDSGTSDSDSETDDSAESNAAEDSYEETNAGNPFGAPAVSQGVLYGQTAIVSGQAVVFMNNTDQQVYSGPTTEN